MSPFWLLLLGGGVAYALSKKGVAPDYKALKPGIPPALPMPEQDAFARTPKALPLNATNTVPPAKITLPPVTSSAITPAGIMGTAGRVIGGGKGFLAIGGSALALTTKLAPATTASITSTINDALKSAWNTIGPFVGLAIFIAFAIVALLPLVFALVGIISRELRRPGAEFQETYRLALQMKTSMTLQMMGDAREAAKRDLSQEEMRLVIHMRNIWLLEFVNQWNACRQKAASFKDWQGTQSSNETGDAAHMEWKLSRGFFLSDDDVDTLENLLLYNGEDLTESQLEWANWPYKQFIQTPGVPWVKVFADARASGATEADWQYIVKSAHAFANAQYYLMASQKMKDALGWISWGPLNEPMKYHPAKEYLDWTNFITGASWIPGINLPSEISGVFFDSIDANGDVHFQNTVLRVKESIQNEGKGFMRPVVSFDHVPDKYSMAALANKLAA